MERLDPHAPPPVSVWILLLKTPGNGVHFRLRLCRGDVVLQARDNAHSRVSAAEPEALCRETNGDRNIGLRPKLETCRCNADNNEALIVKNKLSADDAFISSKAPPP